MADYYNRKGEPITMDEWVEVFDEDRTVQQTFVKDVCVSTVFLGLDHSFLEGASPMIFETMVFPAEDGQITDFLDLECERYSTEKQALAGHKAIVRRIRTREWK